MVRSLARFLSKLARAPGRRHLALLVGARRETSVLFVWLEFEEVLRSDNRRRRLYLNE